MRSEVIALYNMHTAMQVLWSILQWCEPTKSCAYISATKNNKSSFLQWAIFYFKVYSWNGLQDA